MAFKVHKKIQQYIKYTSDELDLYAQTEGSCVHKINTDMIVIMRPYCLDDFKSTLRNHIMHHYIGRYNMKFGGIILEVMNIKLYNGLAAMRADDPNLHIKFNANIYVFIPKVDAILTGVVKHIARKHVGVILYRVFTVNIRVACKVEYDEVSLDKEVKFRIRDFNLQNVIPYIEGELLTTDSALTKTNCTISTSVSNSAEIVAVEQIKIKQEKDAECTDVECTNGAWANLNVSEKEIKGKKEKKPKKTKKPRINGF